MVEPQQIVQVAVSSQLLQLQHAANINSDFAEEFKGFFATGGTLDGMYAHVLKCKADVLITRQQVTTVSAGGRFISPSLFYFPENFMLIFIFNFGLPFLFFSDIIGLAKKYNYWHNEKRGTYGQTY